MKMCRLLHQALTCIMLCLASMLHAQQNPYNEVSISSPNAAALGKYGDIPVSMHTGIPQVSIPLYTVKEGPLELPISLNYHAGGLKVQEQASWVGAGWSLSAGGVITRTVQGAPDEKGTSNVSGQTHGHLSDRGYNSYLWVNTGNTTNPPDLMDLADIVEGKKDGEPDLFFFNFAGYSGKFYFHDDGSPVIVPQQDLRIENNYTGTGSISSFIITTPDGTKYFFGKTSSTSDVDPVEKTDPVTLQSGLSQGNVISSWYLNKILSADDLFTITLTYTQEHYSYYSLSMYPVPDIPPSFQYQDNYEYRLVKNIVQGVRLTQITFSNGQVIFTPGSLREDLGDNGTSLTPDNVTTQARTLAEIAIADGTTTYKKFLFSYSYFSDNFSPLNGYLTNYTINTDKKRLKLNSVQEVSGDNSMANPPHSFEYFSELVPRRLTFGIDHWGFYNGVTNNSTLVPTYTRIDSREEVQGANRDAAWPAMRGGALKKIVYPTGGHTEFEFEPNKTYVSYLKWQWISEFSVAAGYDGNSGTVSSNQYFNGDAYKILFSNPSQGQESYLRIYNSSNVQVNGWGLNPGQSTTVTVTLPAGTYRVEIQKMSAVSGYGTTAAFSRWNTTAISGDVTVGGLRIKTITHHDAIDDESDMVTSYSYLNSAGNSSGILYSRPSYLQKIRNDVIQTIGYQSGFGCTLYGCISCPGSADFMKSPSTVRPMETTQGNHIGYNEVKVQKTNNGYSIYRYYGSNLWDMNTNNVAVLAINATECNNSLPNYPAAPFPHEYKRGELKQEQHLNQAGQLLKETWYYYTYQDNPLTTPALAAAAGPNSVYLPTFYQLSTAKKTETQVVDRNYQPGVGMVETTNNTYFESPYHNQVTRKTNTTSTGELQESKIKYAADYRIAACEPSTTCYSTYNAALNTCASNYAATYAACSTHTCRWNAWQVNEYCKSQARKDYAACTSSNTIGSFKTCLQTAKGSADGSLKPVIELQEVFNNAPVEMSEWRDSKLLSASFYKYDYAADTWGKVYISKTQAINLAVPSTTFTASSNTSTSLSKDSRYQDQSTVKFYAGNLVEVTPKAGVTTSYIWGHNNSLPVVKASGVSHATLKTAYDAVSGNLANLRSQSSLQAALIATYAYNPLVGMTSETDANSKPISYEYDALQRLKLIRDKDNNIIKKISYAYQSFAHTNAVWQATGLTRCKPCPQNSNFFTNIIQNEERDVNGESSTYNNTRWVDAGTTTNCVLPSWQNTTTFRCLLAGGTNTGEREVQQMDMNPCSPTYGNTQWVSVGMNTTACPVIYAVVGYANGDFYGGSYYSDVVVSFFSDEACTVPVSVSNLTVNVQLSYSTNGFGSYTSTQNYTCSGFSTTILSQTLRYYDDGFGNFESYNYLALPGTGYFLPQ